MERSASVPNMPRPVVVHANIEGDLPPSPLSPSKQIDLAVSLDLRKQRRLQKVAQIQQLVKTQRDRTIIAANLNYDMEELSLTNTYDQDTYDFTHEDMSSLGFIGHSFFLLLISYFLSFFVNTNTYCTCTDAKSLSHNQVGVL
jgi:hypothetical protein